MLPTRIGRAPPLTKGRAKATYLFSTEITETTEDTVWRTVV